MRYRSLLILTLAVVGITPVDGQTQRSLVIFHTADIHGGVSARPARWHSADPNRLIGGFAALSRVIQRESGAYALLDSGDIFQGTPEGNITKGSIVISAMNRLGYDAMAIGNHEYDYGENNLRSLKVQARFPFLASNIFNKRNGKLVDYALPAVVLHIGNVRVGVIGIATQTTRTSTLPANVAHLDFTDEVVATARQSKALRMAGADIVIALTHCGLSPSYARKRIEGSTYTPTKEDLAYHGDLAIARGGDVDIVLGGHMHNGLEGGWRDPHSGVWIFQAYERLEAVNRIHIHFDDSNRNKPTISKVSGQLIDLWVDTYGQDTGMLDLVDGYRKSIDGEMSAVIGVAQMALTRKGLDSQLGNWMTDIMRAVGKTDVSIQNTYGLRGDLSAGSITLRDVYEVMPFENTLVTTKLTGRKLRLLIETSLRDGKATMQFSGVHIRFSADVDGRPRAR